MILEKHEDMWKFVVDEVKVVTTNGNIGGGAIMGKGVALQAAKRYPLLPKLLAERLKDGGNHCYSFKEYKIVTFPTKENYWENSKYSLIRRSCKELLNICYDNGIDYIVMPRVGCKNGRLNWNNVKMIIDEELSSSTIKFIVVSL